MPRCAAFNWLQLALISVPALDSSYGSPGSGASCCCWYGCCGCRVMFCISLTRERQCGLRKRQCSAPTPCPRSRSRCSAAVGPSPSCTLCFILFILLVLPRPGTLHTFATGLARGGRKYFRLCALLSLSLSLSVLCMEFIWANLQIIAFRARPETGTWTSITTPIYIWQLPCWHLFNGLRPSYPTPPSSCSPPSLPWRSAAQVDFARWFFLWLSSGFRRDSAQIGDMH